MPNHLAIGLGSLSCYTENMVLAALRALCSAIVLAALRAFCSALHGCKGKLHAPCCQCRKATECTDKVVDFGVE